MSTQTKQKNETKTGPGGRKKPPYNMWQNSWYMIRTAREHCKSVLYLAALTVLFGVSLHLLELFVAPAVLNAVETAQSVGSLLALILLFSAGLVMVAGASAYVEANVLFGRVEVRSCLAIMLHDKVCRTSYPNTEDPAFRRQADKAFRVCGSNAEAAEAVWKTLTDLLTNGISFLIYLALLTALPPAVIALTLAVSAAGFYGGRPFVGWRYRHREEEEDYMKRLVYIREKAVNDRLAKDIRIFGLRDWLYDMHRSTLRLYEDFCKRSETRALAADALDVLLAFLRNGVAYGCLLGMVMNGRLSAPMFLLYFNAVSGFGVWVTGLLGSLSRLREQSLDICIVREFLEAEEPFCLEGGEPLSLARGEKHTLELKNVSFRYPGSDRDTLTNVNLCLEPGERLAVVGLNGAGKTTLVKLLCGFLDPTQGAVLLDGKDIRRYNREDYYRQFAAVFQSFSLLAASVEENVAQAVDGIDRERVRDCLERAGMWEKVEHLPQGLETKLMRSVYDEAVELSGGQLQRLMLARALYKDCPFVILDEPTAALDPIAENDIYQKYSELTAGYTSVYISHRLASTRFCDRILLIERGGIAEEGSHEELLAQGGRYAELFEVQSRYYREGGNENEAEIF